MLFRLPKIIFSLIFSVLFLVVAFLITFEMIFAQITSSGIAIPAKINDPEAQDGDIICTYSDGNKRCNKPYDPAMFGIISDNPAASIEDSDLENPRRIITSGITLVKVSSAQGNIKDGDLITSSDIPGVGQKAIRNGYVLGSAIGEYKSDNPKEVGKVQVLVNIHPASFSGGSRGNLLQFIREGVAVPVFEPVESFRYLLAALMIVIAFSLGMIYFGRSSRAGIEAIGRNPLAKRVIQLTVILNIVLTIVIVLVGLGIAYLILIF